FKYHPIVINKEGVVTLRIKSLVLLCSAAVLLTGCGVPQKSPTPTATATATATANPSPSMSPSVAQSAFTHVPTSCLGAKMLAAMQKIEPTSVWVDTKWKPAHGTDLEQIINSGGIACSYGVQRAAIGLTAYWAIDDGTLFNSRIPLWTKAGFIKVDVPGVSESAAYFLLKPQSSTQEFHLWQLDMLVHGAWIQLGVSFGDSLVANQSLIEATVQSLS
ncbi:MAG: hypothetical protein WCO85_07885, partial [Actinomycetes bacterium]